MAAADSIVIVPRTLPPVPAKHKEFLQYVQSNPDSPMTELLEPYIIYDNTLREIFAQEPNHPIIKDCYLNVMPLYDENGSVNVKVRARNMSSEPEEVKQKYIMPLSETNRKPDGAPAIVDTFKEFQTNFNLFSESSLADLDWDNVIAAGSSVVSALLPVPKKYRDSKRTLREYYHEKLAPASDVDLFIYGLNEEQAIAKIKQIERKIKDSILYEVTTIRTKNAITIASQYPTRHVQIVLRLYKSISEILTGFDVDCSCAAYDGKQVYLAPRALSSYITQINRIDLSRRSPSYESRLSKYSHRGFEVFWPFLDRSKIDPTIFERSFTRTVGLARLLILEQLPKSSDREAYIEQRREERGRPALNQFISRSRKLRGDIKTEWEDEIPEWDDPQDVSDYHTFTVPYGPKFHARKIEKLLFTKDLLLNAEWNRSAQRETSLHRHPTFFGFIEDIIHDCCGSCPTPLNEEEEEIAKEENKIYVSGDISFIKDNPGRQTIGSFNPITETDWTDMAYLGNATGLCRAIVEQDLKQVEDWLAQEEVDPNCRDHTGRTPLHLACMESTPEIVQCLVDHGARLISRLADGRTALHIAAARGSAEIVKILLLKNEDNEEAELVKVELRKEAKARAKKEARDQEKRTNQEDQNISSLQELDDEVFLDDYSQDSDEDFHSTTTGSFVKLKGSDDPIEDTNHTKEEEIEPDVLDINIHAWDTNCSPLHLAILNGHTEVVQELVGSFGADLFLPIKIRNEYDRTPTGAILALVIPLLLLPLEKSIEMASALLELGASTTQGDMNRHTPIHYYACNASRELVDLLIKKDKPAVKQALSHVSASGYYHNPSVYSALVMALQARNLSHVRKFLQNGASPKIEFREFFKSAQAYVDGFSQKPAEQAEEQFLHSVEQPIILAVQTEQPSIVMDLIRSGADINTLSVQGQNVLGIENYRLNHKGETLLDTVRSKLQLLRDYKGDAIYNPLPDAIEHDDDYYLKDLIPGSYKHWRVTKSLKDTRLQYDQQKKHYDENQTTYEKNSKEKLKAISALLKEFENLEETLVQAGAKSFQELHPEIKHDPPNTNSFFGYRPGGTNNQKFQPLKFMFPGIYQDITTDYAELFEAAWSGDLNMIKTLTLSMWGPDHEKLPLHIAVEDKDYCTPVSIAIWRGHLDVAAVMMDIALSQYEPEDENSRARFRLVVGDSIEVVRDIIDDQFTIENVGEAITQVKSNFHPCQFLQSRCPTEGDKYLSLFSHAVESDNVELFKYLLELFHQYSPTADEDVQSTVTNQVRGAFITALRSGNTRMVADIIKLTGVGIQFDQILNQSGIEVNEKPKYYQGLSVRGRKPTDWAKFGPGRYRRWIAPDNSVTPLLQAAIYGNIDIVEWFLSTAPLRCYSEFSETYKNDPRLQALAQENGGVDQTIRRFLGLRSELVIHCAVLNGKANEDTKLIEYLIQNTPESLEAKSFDGYTPLALAFTTCKKAVAELLIKAGANQTVRDNQGNNLIHLAIAGWHQSYKMKQVDKIKELLDLIDSRLVPSMLTERCSQDPGSLTPFAAWLYSVRRFHRQAPTLPFTKYDPSRDSEHIDGLRMLLNFASKYTKQEHLEILDGAGNTPFHVVVGMKCPQLLQVLLEYRPDLVNRESAVGATAVELAEASWIAEATKQPPLLADAAGHNLKHYVEEYKPITQRKAEWFAMQEQDDGKETDYRSECRVVWDLCRSKYAEGDFKRKLVTVAEANEVAKRITIMQGVRLANVRRSTDEKFTDEVAHWHDWDNS